MTLVDASARFTKDYFSSEEEDTELYSFYECPRCHERVGFERKNLEKHEHQQFTNLSSEDSARIDSFVAAHPIDSRSFLDFYCPGCHLGVRLYFSFWAGGKADSGFNLDKIIEIEATPVV